MILLKSNAQLQATFQQLIRTMKINVEWPGLFAVVNNSLILPGRVRSLVFNLDTRRVGTDILEFQQDGDKTEEAGDSISLTNAVNMVLFIFGKWGAIGGLKVEKNYAQLNQMFRGILKEIGAETSFSGEELKFYRKGVRITYEDVIQDLLDARKERENGGQEGGDAGGLGLWHEMRWLTEKAVIQKQQPKGDDTKTRLGKNFYRVDYACPDCGEQLYMVLYPVDREYPVETDEGRVYLARAYACDGCLSLYTPRPGRLLQEGDIYALRFEEDRAAFEDYLELLGATGGRSANYKFNEYEADHNRKDRQAPEPLEDALAKTQSMTLEELQELVGRMDAGFFPADQVRRFGGPVRKRFSEAVARRKKEEKDAVGTISEGMILEPSGRLSGPAGVNGGHSAARPESGRECKKKGGAKPEAVLQFRGKQNASPEAGERFRGGGSERQWAGRLSREEAGAYPASSRLSREKGAAGQEAGRASHGGRKAGREAEAGKESQGERDTVQESVKQSHGRSMPQPQTGGGPRGANEASPDTEKRFRRAETPEAPHQERKDAAGTEENLKRRAKALKGKSYAELARAIEDIRGEDFPESVKGPILWQLHRQKLEQAEREARALASRLPEKLDKKEYLALVETLDGYEEIDTSALRRKLDERLDLYEQGEIGLQIKRAGKKSREDLALLLQELSELDFEERNLAPYREKIRRKISEMDQAAMDALCPDIDRISFEEGMRVYELISSGFYLPELKEDRLRLLEKRLNALKEEEARQLVRKLQRDLEEKIDDLEGMDFCGRTGAGYREESGGVGIYAGDMGKYEFPLLVCSSSRNAGKWEGFVLTPDHIFYRSKMKKGVVSIPDIRETASFSGVLRKGIFILTKDGKMTKIPTALREDEWRAFAGVIGDFAKYLQAKPESRQISYLAKEEHAVKCCYRCGYEFREGDVCPRCGSKGNR